MTLRHETSAMPKAALWRSQLEALKQQMLSWWNERSTQERRLLKVCAALLMVALVWTLGLRPALQSIAQSREQLPRLRAEAAQVQAYILEAQSLQRLQTGQIADADLTQALQDSLTRAGLNESVTLTELAGSDRSGRQWEVALFNAGAAGVMEWLAELPYLLRLQASVVDLRRANVDGRDRPGHVSGRILVRQPGKDQP